MRRRGMGAGALMKKKMQEEKYKQKANELSNQQMEQLSQHLEAFHANLEEFAAKHKQVIIIIFYVSFVRMVKFVSKCYSYIHHCVCQ